MGFITELISVQHQTLECCSVEYRHLLFYRSPNSQELWGASCHRSSCPRFPCPNLWWHHHHPIGIWTVVLCCTGRKPCPAVDVLHNKLRSETNSRMMLLLTLNSYEDNLLSCHWWLRSHHQLSGLQQLILQVVFSLHFADLILISHRRH